MVLIPIIPDNIPPAPAPMAKIRMIAKYRDALKRSFEVPFLIKRTRYDVPLFRLPIHIVLA